MSISGRKWVGTMSVLVLFTVAFLLRAVGADYGYFHGDERINEAAKVLTGQLVPEQHFYPPLINYLNAIGLAGLFGLGPPLPVLHMSAMERSVQSIELLRERCLAPVL